MGPECLGTDWIRLTYDPGPQAHFGFIALTWAFDPLVAGAGPQKNVFDPIGAVGRCPTPLDHPSVRGEAKYCADRQDKALGTGHAAATPISGVAGLRTGRSDRWDVSMAVQQ